MPAITAYTTIVGLVYQASFRHIWDPRGLQQLVHELLHSIVPAGALLYWLFFAGKGLCNSQIFTWGIYSLAYLIFILSRGAVSTAYPCPFVNLPETGMQQILIKAAITKCADKTSFIFQKGLLNAGKNN